MILNLERPEWAKLEILQTNQGQHSRPIQIFLSPFYGRFGGAARAVVSVQQRPTTAIHAGQRRVVRRNDVRGRQWATAVGATQSWVPGRKGLDRTHAHHFGTERTQFRGVRRVTHIRHTRIRFCGGAGTAAVLFVDLNDVVSVSRKRWCVPRQRRAGAPTPPCPFAIDQAGLLFQWWAGLAAVLWLRGNDGVAGLGAGHFIARAKSTP